MPLLLHIEWVRQSDNANPYLRVQAIGGNSGKLKWRHTQEHAIEAIEKNVYQYFIRLGFDIQRVEIGVTPQGLKYLKTQSDADQPTTLTRLPNNPE